MPVFVALLAKPVFQVSYIHGSSLGTIVQSTLSRTELVCLIWGSTTSTFLPSAVRGLFDDAERDHPVLGRLAKLLYLMELLGGTTPYPDAPQTYLDVVLDFCPIKDYIRSHKDAFSIFVQMFLANRQLGLLERWLCTVQWNPCRSWKIQELLGANGEWTDIVDIRPFCHATNLGPDQTILMNGGWGCDITEVMLPKNSSKTSIFTKRTGRATQRFLIILGDMDVGDLNQHMAGLMDKKLEVNPLITAYKHDDSRMYIWTFVDLRMSLVSYFRAYAKPTHIIVCGEEREGAVRAMLCSHAARKDKGTLYPEHKVSHKENIVRIDRMDMGGLYDMRKFEVSLRSKYGKEKP